MTRLLLDGAKPDRILCLTYTKSAAAEMQGRLFDQLGSWAMMPDALLAEKIEEIGGDVRDDEALRQARRLFALALETPGGLKIQTIHSFCQYLLSRFPLEAGIPPGFRVLDDQTATRTDWRSTNARARAGRLGRRATGGRRRPSGDADERRPLQQILDAALSNDRGKLERFFAESGSMTAMRLCAQRSVRAHGAGERDTYERIATEFCARRKAEEDRLIAVDRLADGRHKDRCRARRGAGAGDRAGLGCCGLSRLPHGVPDQGRRTYASGWRRRSREGVAGTLRLS